MKFHDVVRGNWNGVILEIDVPIASEIKSFVAIKGLLYATSFSKLRPITAAYAIIDSVEGFIYAGSSGNIRVRLNQHRSGLNTNTHDNKNLMDLFNRRQQDDFTLILFQCQDREEAFDIEQHIIDYSDGLGLCLNRSKNSRSNIEFEFTKEHREKISKRMRERIITDETRDKLSKSLKGRVFDQVTHEKMSSSAINSLKRTDRLKRLLKQSEASKKRVIVDGIEYNSIREASNRTGVKPSAISYRLNSKSSTFSNWNYKE